MLKEIKVTFNYNTETDAVTNILTVIDGVETKKKTTKSKKEVVVELATEAIITREDNKLVFNNKAVADMNLQHEDRVVINWVKEKGVKKMTAQIGTDLAFDQEGSGNKLSKTNTVQYKGKQNLILAEIGAEFTIKPSKEEGIWILVPTAGAIDKVSSLEDAIKEAENTEIDLITEEDETFNLDEVGFQL